MSSAAYYAEEVDPSLVKLPPNLKAVQINLGVASSLIGWAHVQNDSCLS